MTTLRNFQSEIEEIRAHELARQRTQGVRVLPSHDGQRGEARAPGVPEAGGTTLYDLSSLHSSEQEERILGEYIFRIGQRPPLDPLFSGEQLDSAPGWTGIKKTQEEVDGLAARLSRAQDDIGGKTSVLHRIGGLHPRAALLLRLPPPSVAMTPEVRCAVVGNVDSGKSTTLGVLTRGALDDGRGRARVTLFRHKHEIETGRTSSVGMEILGFSEAGVPILPGATGPHDVEGARRDKLGWDEISARSAKIISFSDLAGHERYLKTTLYGLTSGAPSCVILMIGANAGLIGMAKEHLAIALALNVPVIVCITKIDMTPPKILAETNKQVVKILRSPGCRKAPVFVNSIEVAVELTSTFAHRKMCPIFRISNVTGDGLDYVGKFAWLISCSNQERDGHFLVLYEIIRPCFTVELSGLLTSVVILGWNVAPQQTAPLSTGSPLHWRHAIILYTNMYGSPINAADAVQCVARTVSQVRIIHSRPSLVLIVFPSCLTSIPIREMWLPLQHLCVYQGTVVHDLLVVIDNLVKLVRAFAETALDTLLRSGAFCSLSLLPQSMGHYVMGSIRYKTNRSRMKSVGICGKAPRG
ncbi:P-loop containing nucleoside triphosphate hydrolase protein, partial [Butyriboletus roseoflavus]